MNPLPKHASILVIGRCHGDDEDTQLVLFDVTSEEAGRNFREEMSVLAGEDPNDPVPEDGPGAIYINAMFASKSPIYSL